MDELRSRRTSNRPRASKVPTTAPSSAREVADLAWAGRHERAIEVAGNALAASDAPLATRVDLLDLRAESHLALGNIAFARADAAQMRELADAAKSAPLKARAGNRLALVQMRAGDTKTAVRTAAAALAAARRAKHAPLEAMSLFRLGEVQFRVGASEAAVRSLTRAAAMFDALGDTVNQGRALWALAAGRSNQGRAADANRAAKAALGLAQRCGDRYGVGNALNMLMFNEADIAVRLKLLQQSFAAFEAAGYLERQGVAVHNLGVAYINLGLYRRARAACFRGRATSTFARSRRRA
jgi:tetratricopeptide (TPR) repeat protein